MTSPRLVSPLLRRPIELGESISIDFPDGKGVSAHFAGVDIAPGGSSFTIFCTPHHEVEGVQREKAGVEAQDDTEVDTPYVLPESLTEKLKRRVMYLEEELAGTQDDCHEIIRQREEALNRAERLETELRAANEKAQTVIVNIYSKD